PAMMRLVEAERMQKTRTSTQEEVWMVLAARALSGVSEDIRLEVDGTPHQGNFARRLNGSELEAAPLVIANRGAETVNAVVTTVAAHAQPLPAGGDGFTIERSYYTLDGAEANITEAAQNERFVVVLRVE